MINDTLMVLLLFDLFIRWKQIVLLLLILKAVIGFYLLLHICCDCLNSFCSDVK